MGCTGIYDHPLGAGGQSQGLWNSDSQTVIPQKGSHSSPGSLLEMPLLRPHPRQAESESLGGGPCQLV